MKYFPFADLLDSEPANIAIFSTYQLDPDFFERQLLRCATLAKARRILVFLDASQWHNLLRQDTPSRSLNLRYLVVPVHRSQGVFHPKLNLLLYESGGQVQCGSNNLTRSGCSSNLELLNAFNFGSEGDHEEATSLAQEAFTFFKRVCDDAEEEPAKIARKWLEETAACFPWLTQPIAVSVSRKVRLVHTYESSLWERLAAPLDATPPSRLLVISPFHDRDGEMLKRVQQRWPRCRTEVLVQQQITSLPLKAIEKLNNSINLSELRNSKRRLHAKLIAWETEGGTGCLVGSANFTAAAFDGRNVETCLIVSEAADLVASLFDKELRKRAIALEEFEPGTENEPKAGESQATNLRLTAALLIDGRELRVSYATRLPVKPSKLRVAIRTPGEPYPRALASLPVKDAGKATVSIPPAALGGTHGTILASLIAEFQDHQEESAPIWVIQEDRLTHEPGGEGGSSAEKRVKETGEGLTEILEEIAKRDGVAAVIEYLRHTDIQFNDGSAGLAIGRRFHLRVHDPFHPDVAPEWLLHLTAGTDDLASAIQDFVERHERYRLRRHAKNGNINGMENFLDVFTALIRLLYVYYQRSMQLDARQKEPEIKTGYYRKNEERKVKPLVSKYDVISRTSAFIGIATGGIASEEAHCYCKGFLLAVSAHLNNSLLLAHVAKTLNFAGEVRAALMIAQKLRFAPNETVQSGTAPKRPADCLPAESKLVRDTLVKVGIPEPSGKEILAALEQYRMFTERELAGFGSELQAK
jgi:hypothetical protein